MTPVPVAVSALVDDLRSPDPRVRDDGAFSALARMAGEGALDDHLVELGDRALDLLADGEVQARTFGALLVAVVADRDNVTGAASAGAKPETEVVHPAVRADALQALGSALAEVHAFYGRPS